MVPALGSQRSAVHVETAAPNYLESMKEVLQYHTEGDAVEVLKEEAPAEDIFLGRCWSVWSSLCSVRSRQSIGPKGSRWPRC